MLYRLLLVQGKATSRPQQNIFHPCRQNRDKNDTKHEANSRADRTRENEGIPSPVQSKGRSEMYVRPQQSNHGSSTISLR